MSEAGYIQGAADDQEAWACSLTPQAFWKYHSKLLGTNEEDLPSLIGEMMAEERGPEAAPICVKPTSSLFISSSQSPDLDPFDAIISCTSDALTTTKVEHAKGKKYLHLPLVPGKLGSRDLRTQLSRLPQFMEGLHLGEGTEQKILVCDPTGKDLCVGVALVILCLYMDQTGRMHNSPLTTNIDKNFIKQRLAWITTSSPILNPSRATLQSVNAFLMPDQSSERPDSKAPQQIDWSTSTLVLVDDDGVPIPIPVTDIPKPSPSPISTTEPPRGTPSPQSLAGGRPAIHIPVTDIPYDI